MPKISHSRRMHQGPTVFLKAAVGMMRSICLHKCVLLILAVVLAFQTAALAQDARLDDIIVTNTRDDLLVYLKVEGAFTEKMKTAILSGVVTSFSFIVELYRVRDFWTDAQVAAVTVTHTIKYNTLKKEFAVKRSWDDDNPLNTTSFDTARQLMSDVDSLKIIPLSRLEKGQRYQIRAKAELSKVTLPFYLHYVLFFISLWDFETDWYAIDFIY